MRSRTPKVVVIAGPNGAGKTTVAEDIVGRVFGIPEFVNADVIAQGLSGFSPDAVAVRAGRIMLGRLKELAAAGQDFAFETTLASRSFAPMLRSWQAHGYECQLVFVWLSNPLLAEERVRGRVARGGHDIPTPVIRRRYERSLRNLFNLYLPIVDGWRLLDNSGPGAATLIAAKGVGGTVEIVEMEIWEILRGRYMNIEPGGGTPPHVAEPRIADPLTAQIVAAANRAVRAAIREHKLLGFPIVAWDREHGCVKIIPPEHIRIETDSDDRRGDASVVMK